MKISLSVVLEYSLYNSNDLSRIGLLTITDASKNTMKYLVGLLKKHRNDYCLMLQNDNFYCDAHWNIVRKMTKVTNPYDRFNPLGMSRC